MGKKYDIPLSEIYGPSEGSRVIVENTKFGGNISMVNRSGMPPKDIINLNDREVDKLMEILVAYLTGRDKCDLGIRFEEYEVE